ncbi:MAG: 50S ribosomal protein L10 [Dehalococcoidales bacterium]|jgi:large subunit ribosomal protein L10|nr:50S ribosomal protein L10 [Dehalococcoidales bacterium]MDD5604827.1 50S ribosomal protein L10 [Dehalococcoidales bacterium]MDX9985960.1 50S ribosomal protein L10 [Dehalococcoidales bacterium]
MQRKAKIREHKVKVVKEVAESFKKSQVVVLTNYSGMTTADITALRRKLKAGGVEYRVVKNTLARFAADESGQSFDRSIFNGPVAAAFGFDDPVVAAKLVVDFAKNGDIPISIVGGIIGDSLLSADDVKELAQLPSREILLAKVVGGIQWPLTGLVSCLAGPIRGLAYILQARINQLEEA